jgi:hypothetical protein
MRDGLIWGYSDISQRDFLLLALRHQKLVERIKKSELR